MAYDSALAIALYAVIESEKVTIVILHSPAVNTLRRR